MGGPVWNEGVPNIIKLLERIVWVVIMVQDKGIIEMARPVLGGKIGEHPDRQRDL